jgi:hypothetical protein
MKATTRLKTVISEIPNFRRQNRQLYDLESILLIGIIPVLCGAETWNQMDEYAESKEQKMLLKIFPYSIQ